MLDALKFAFEILIVGALALPWIAVLSRMFPISAESEFPSFLSIVPDAARASVTIAVILAFGYVTGSVVSRASRDLFNDELLKPLPTEDLIREAVYQDAYCGQDLMNMDENLPNIGEFVELDESLPLFDEYDPLPPKSKITLKNEVSLKQKHRTLHEKYKKAFCPGLDSPAKLDEHIKNMFRLQESELLLVGEDRLERVKQYYDQITVLRGAAFNGLMLFSICLLGFFGNIKLRFAGRPRLVWVAFILPAFLVGFGLYSLHGHLDETIATARVIYNVPELTVNPTVPQVISVLRSDPPLAELILVLLGIVGFSIVKRARAPAPYAATCVIAAIVTAICLGSWWWTEIMYDLQVVHSQIELHRVVAPSNVSAPAEGPQESTRKPPASPGPGDKS
jgi:hypothetical protein